MKKGRILAGFTEWNGQNDDETRLNELARELARWYSKGGGGHSLYMFNGAGTPFAAISDKR